jgi:type II secretory pathway pseudopilin PulG
MSLWVWVAVIAGVLTALLLLFLVVGTPSRRRAAKREEAGRLRQEAEEGLRSAAGREATAAQEQAAAERERVAAEEKLKEADAVDPDLPDEAANLNAQRPAQATDEAAPAKPLGDR